LTDHGRFADVPAERIIATLREYCPRILEVGGFKGADFTNEEEARP